MPLRIATANLFFGRVPPTALSSFLGRHAPSVLAVQELVPSLETVIRKSLPNGTVGELHYGMRLGLFSTGPVSLRRLPLRSHDSLVATLPEGPEVIAVHLLAPHRPPPWRTFSHRAEDAAVLSRYLAEAPEGPRILLGDLNSSPIWPTYRRLRRHLDDAASLVARRHGHRPRRTWGPWPGSPRLLRLDHVLVSGVEVVAAEVVDLPGSDHSAVVIDLDL